MTEDNPYELRRLLVLSIPALLIGIGSAVVLRLVDLLAHLLHDVLWVDLPTAFGDAEPAAWWTFTVLTLTGAAIGAVAWLMPGHAGPDSATTEFAGPFPEVKAVPSVAIVTVLSLAGGVSLGPENPVIAINVALALSLIARLTTTIPPQLIVMLTVSATVGALFGTPVAAALLLTGTVGALKGGSLWDRLFLPVAAAAAGALTNLMLGGEAIAFQLDPIVEIKPVYLLTGFIVAAVSAALGIAASYLFPYVHRAFHALRNPLIFTTLGGAVLGVLAIIGGPLTMFKGLEETATLLEHPDDYTSTQLLAFAGIKMVALLVAASAGFRGGRIFPIVFIGVALGLAGSVLVPETPISLAVACGVLGVTLVATRDGWVAMFIGVALVGDTAVLPLLCVIILPVWLIVTKTREFIIHPDEVHGAVKAPA